MTNWLKIILIVIGSVLVIDQLYLFGFPIGGFLPDLSIYDPTGSPFLRHWMLGVALIVIGAIIPSRKRRK